MDSTLQLHSMATGLQARVLFCMAGQLVPASCMFMRVKIYGDVDAQSCYTTAINKATAVSVTPEELISIYLYSRGLSDNRYAPFPAGAIVIESFWSPFKQGTILKVSHMCQTPDAEAYSLCGCCYSIHGLHTAHMSSSGDAHLHRVLKPISMKM